MDPGHIASDLESVLLSEAEILSRLDELAADIERDYAGDDLLLVGVLGGAAMMTVDLARALRRHVEIGWVMARSYGAGVRSSGTVHILKDLDVDITGRHVLLVDAVVDTGLTASSLIADLTSRQPASVKMCALFRKPKAATMTDPPAYVGFDLGEGMLVGYGLDYAGRYRNLRCCAVLAPHVYDSSADTVSWPPDVSATPGV